MRKSEMDSLELGYTAAKASGFSFPGSVSREQFDDVA
jgi:hypothetical protein